MKDIGTRHFGTYARRVVAALAVLFFVAATMKHAPKMHVGDFISKHWLDPWLKKGEK